MNFGDKEYTKKKERRKAVRVVLQILILLVLAAVLAFALFTFRKYVPFQQRSEVPVSGDNGFVALSYFGIARTGDQNLIARERLREHLQAMKNSGYETITQQDIIDYYAGVKQLPKKALYLNFEDGRRDTAIFAQKILEDLNYKASMMTYPEKFALRDNKFLMPSDLQDLQQTSFWEMGTNGYRLAFINVYDRYDNYLGELTPLKHVMVAPYIGRKYNHYLMDYLRDKDFFPKESYNMMQDRISYDYEKLRDVYMEELGFLPQAHVLMHSNTGAFGNNREVSAVNERWITKLFAMNFNREGYSWNSRESSIYDLTRMQPQSYWYANHVLMRVLHDQKQDVVFTRGRTDEDSKWKILAGQPEYKDEKIVLTTEPQGNSIVMLKNAPHSANLHLTVTLTGNKAGTQSIYLRADEALKRSVSVHISGRYLYVYENQRELLKLDIDKFLGKEPISIDQDRKAAEVAALTTFARYAPTKEQAEIYAKRLTIREQQPAAGIEDGVKEYIAPISLREPGHHELEVFLVGHSLKLKLDGKDIEQELYIEQLVSGNVALRADWQGIGWSQRNLIDDVYDGVFEKLMIYDYSYGKEEDTVLYSSKLDGLEGLLYFIKSKWEQLLHFFVNKF